MSILLLSGIVLTVVPLMILEGFALFMLFTFTRDDNDAKSAVNLALIVLAVGVLCLVGYFLRFFI
ncbi:hypothetical protein CO057_00785 [Candidatus Uhrbacteria bacterium CG_4_9_14_0_2_um_filter_41_50]|uniref:Uncharacterized protein n=1 Tax=Candidatus Uhrbacteria bacterium CG_4_9_14_0_2_um_filter_41_50 TaxID=1975031 RepID=A0A2M8EQ09_9BACT|nr:MAG: hypothetical protein COZ45_00390 [Candidatus Uhrbacteria bacterium CG_4_10_14_3_um_filter_41_21]PIZ54424.1 MAG: hypothetical protein COY24_03820 [Candidatus Uhrbacteria bacterium CG_4_10_14_0_2_um_filter_41_21]PJB85035.1 MAG: hypothetical protein CO086_00465 [Candidatus Uhrbacteria bacterium CG_4_9_14_0_8_um_filter_41_16]PJC24814.1 MAG: hypothetical protein CO057_00785 [Candidatus Uhrbacteria bacterium CG_4_9_14_0_2_um_filter_41_50]PJE74941.1 MAG: hypothetical protein COV03_02540 [Candi